MNVRLEELDAARYSREVLPRTHELWANGRSLEQYSAQIGEIARSAYGRRSYRTFALTSDDGRVLASFKRYERDARAGKALLRAAGIGAVFTPPEERGRGYASAMLGLALDRARASGLDFVYLFSDIHPQFYKALGFIELPSRSISLRADALDGKRIAAAAAGERDWAGIRSCFDAMESSRNSALLRAPAVWSWIRMRLRHGSDHAEGQPVQLTVRRGKGIAAYVIGQREPKHDAFVLEEAGFAAESERDLIQPLLRCAAGDLRRIVGWLPPSPLRALLPRGSVRRRSDAVWMAAPLTAAGEEFVRLAAASGPADAVWALDHI